MRSPIEALASRPMEPTHMLAWSDRISPNILPVTTTSNWPGAHHLHRRIVDIHMIERDVRIFRRHLDHHVAPQLAGFQHIGLVDAAQAAFSALRRAEADMRDPAHFVFGIGHDVLPCALARRRACACPFRRNRRRRSVRARSADRSGWRFPASARDRSSSPANILAGRRLANRPAPCAGPASPVRAADGAPARRTRDPRPRRTGSHRGPRHSERFRRKRMAVPPIGGRADIGIPSQFEASYIQRRPAFLSLQP